jgi:hypothetical protein
MAAVTETVWRSRAFGLELEGDFEAPGLVPVDVPGDGPSTRLRLVGAAELSARFPGGGVARRLLEERFPPDSADVARSIDWAPGHGYRLYARHFGLALVSEDGAEVLCAPPDDEPWSWQRFLVGRVLPWAAVLRGREVLHASAATLRGRAVAFVGPTGMGKTSLATAVVLGGGGFLTDDVLALERRGEEILAHPGAAIAALRDAPAGDLGEVLGDSGKTYVAVARESGPVPLAAVYFLTREGHATAPAPPARAVAPDRATPPGAAAPPIERIERPDARLLLGSTFNQSIRTPARMTRQLELCADLAASVPMFRLRIAPGVGPTALADAVGRHAWW